MIGVVDSLSVADLIIVVAAVGLAVDRIADWRGWSRSSKVLRRENEDLLRRNQELEQTVGRHEALIASLEAKIAELERTNQAAVLRVISQHEEHANSRHDKTIAVLTAILNALNKTGATP